MVAHPAQRARQRVQWIKRWIERSRTRARAPVPTIHEPVMTRGAIALRRPTARVANRPPRAVSRYIASPSSGANRSSEASQCNEAPRPPSLGARPRRRLHRRHPRPRAPHRLAHDRSSRKQVGRIRRRSDRYAKHIARAAHEWCAARSFCPPVSTRYIPTAQPVPSRPPFIPSAFPLSVS